MNFFDILLAVPLAAVVWVLLSNGVALFSIIKAVIALGLLFAALVFVDFPQGWTEGSFLYSPLMAAVNFILNVCGAL